MLQKTSRARRPSPPGSDVPTKHCKKKGRKSPTLPELPIDVLQKVLSCVTLRDLARAECVNKHWRKAIADHHLWPRLLKKSAPALERMPIEAWEAKRLIRSQNSATCAIKQGKFVRLNFPKTDETRIVTSVDGRGYMATFGGSSGVAQAWDITADQPEKLATLKKRDHPVYAIRTSLDGSRVAVVYGDGFGVFWNVRESTTEAFRFACALPLQACVISADLNKIAVQQSDNKTTILSLQGNRQTMQEVPSPFGKLYDDIAAWEGRYLVFFDHDDEPHLNGFDLLSRQSVDITSEVKEPWYSEGFDVSSDGGQVVFGARGPSPDLEKSDPFASIVKFNVYSFKTGIKSSTYLRAGPRRALFLDKSERWFTSTGYGWGFLFNIRHKSEPRVFGTQESHSSIVALAVNPSQTHVVCLGKDHRERELILWDLEDTDHEILLPDEPLGLVDSLAFNAIGRHLTANPSNQVATVFCFQ